MNKFRPYQIKDFKAINDAFEKINSVLYQSPTGSGKSVILEGFVLKHRDKKILILVHKRELVFQLQAILKAQKLNVGVIIGNIQENLEADIIIASIRTVTLDKRIESILSKNFDTIIVDEAHHIRTSSYENVLDQYGLQNPNHHLLGLTATPYRKDKKPLNKYFQTLIVGETIENLQNQGYLSKYKVFYTPTPEIDEEVESSGNEYQIQSLSNYMRKPEMLQFLVDSYKKEGKDGQMIVFCVDKKHAKDIQNIYKQNGYTSIAHIDSDTDLEERKQILLRFEQNKLRIITCIETLTEGVNLPETKVIQLARPTKSLVLYLQMVGRGGRPKSDGSECIILDNAGCSLEHRLPNSPREWSLNPNINPSNPGKKHKVVGKRQDGTFTEDETEMAFLELVEMTPEEYVLNISGGIEKSEQFNQDINNKCWEMLNELNEWFILKTKISGLVNKYHKEFSSYYCYKIMMRFENSDFEITKSNNKYLEISPSYNMYSVRSNEEQSQKLKAQITMGKIAETLLNPKTITHINNVFDEVKELQSQIIDINDLKETKKKFEQEQFKIKLTHFLQLNKEIELPSPIRLGDYYRDEDNWYTRNNKRYTKITFFKNKLNLTNDVTFTNDEDLDGKVKKLTQEKLLEILKNTKYQFPA